jgi:hypothetical protein
VRPAEDGRVAEEQVPMLCQDPNDPTPCVLMVKAVDPLHRRVH